MTTCFTATPGVEVITTTADIPALGSIAINAFVLHGSEPVLVDTGTVAGAPEFMDALASVIDPAELRWIWLTHTDFDHIGSLAALLESNPRLRVITSFLGVGIMGLSSAPLPMDRVYLINPGQSVTVGDRRLTAVKPPVYDNPITTGFVDDRSGVLFSSDCFGALLPAVPQDAADLDTEHCRPGRSAGRRSTRPGCTASIATPSVTPSIGCGRSSQPWCAAATCRPPPAPCSTFSSNRWRWCPPPTPSSAQITPLSKPCSPAWSTSRPQVTAEGGTGVQRQLRHRPPITTSASAAGWCPPGQVAVASWPGPPS